MDQAGISIIDATSKAEWLKAWIGIRDHAAPDVVVNALNDIAGARMDDEAGRAAVVADDAVRDVVPNDVFGNIGAGTVDKPSDNVASAIELSDGV